MARLRVRTAKAARQREVGKGGAQRVELPQQTASMSNEVIKFEEFELDSAAFELRQGGSLVKLERIPLELLILLAKRRGELVTREEILEKIWGKDVFVDADNSINTAVRKIRNALKEDPEN